MQFDDALQLGSRAIAARTQRCTYLRVNNLRKADEFVTVTLLHTGEKSGLRGQIESGFLAHVH